MKKLRLLSVTLHPQFLADDGDNLTPLQVQPITMLAADWPNVLAQFAEGMEQLRAQVEQRDGVPAHSENN
jgi:hypothetical protein